MIFAKGVANGFPISGIVSNKELMDTLDVGSLGGTYAGNAVACAAGVAAQEVFQGEDMEGRVGRRSEQLFGRLRGFKEDEEVGHLIAEVRGVGVSRFLVLDHLSSSRVSTLSCRAEIPVVIGVGPVGWILKGKSKGRGGNIGGEEGGGRNAGRAWQAAFTSRIRLS